MCVAKHWGKKKFRRRIKKKHFFNREPYADKYRQLAEQSKIILSAKPINYLKIVIYKF